MLHSADEEERNLNYSPEAFRLRTSHVVPGEWSPLKELDHSAEWLAWDFVGHREIFFALYPETPLLLHPTCAAAYEHNKPVFLPITTELVPTGYHYLDPRIFAKKWKDVQLDAILAWSLGRTWNDNRPDGSASYPALGLELSPGDNLVIQKEQPWALTEPNVRLLSPNPWNNKTTPSPAKTDPQWVQPPLPSPSSSSDAEPVHRPQVDSIPWIGETDCEFLPRDQLIDFQGDHVTVLGDSSDFLTSFKEDRTAHEVQLQAIPEQLEWFKCQLEWFTRQKDSWEEHCRDEIDKIGNLRRKPIDAYNVRHVPVWYIDHNINLLRYTIGAYEEVLDAHAIAQKLDFDGKLTNIEFYKAQAQVDRDAEREYSKLPFIFDVWAEAPIANLL